MSSFTEEVTSELCVLGGRGVLGVVCTGRGLPDLRKRKPGWDLVGR